METLRPALVCGALLAALEASAGRSRSRKRDQLPDTIGLAIKGELLRRAVREDPEPDAFEQWLLDAVERSAAQGATCAMARAVLEEWRLAHRMSAFGTWLEHGAPSEDARAMTSSKR
jgi:hypothetical protein